MSSDGGVAKVGISINPLYRLSSVRSQWPIIRRIDVAYGVSERHARLIERAAHQRLAAFSQGNELFKCSAAEAREAVEQALDSMGLRFVPFNEALAKRKWVREASEDAPTTNFTFRFDDALRQKAERYAKADKRSLGVWLSLIVEEKIAELEKETPPRKPRAR